MAHGRYAHLFSLSPEWHHCLTAVSPEPIELCFQRQCNGSAQITGSLSLVLILHHNRDCIGSRDHFDVGKLPLHLVLQQLPDTVHLGFVHGREINRRRYIVAFIACQTCLKGNAIWFALFLKYLIPVRFEEVGDVA